MHKQVEFYKGRRQRAVPVGRGISTSLIGGRVLQDGSPPQTRALPSPRGLGGRIPVRLRESRRAALVALVGSGWDHERSWVARVCLIYAERILRFQVRRLWLRLSRSLSVRLSLTPSLSLSLSLSLNLFSSLSPRLSLSFLMIMKETERAEEKKEKQKKKKQKKNTTRRNERQNIEVDNPKVASEMPWRCPLLAFSLILFSKS